MLSNRDIENLLDTVGGEYEWELVPGGKEFNVWISDADPRFRLHVHREKELVILNKGRHYTGFRAVPIPFGEDEVGIDIVRMYLGHPEVVFDRAAGMADGMLGIDVEFV